MPYSLRTRKVKEDAQVLHKGVVNEINTLGDNVKSRVSKRASPKTAAPKEGKPAKEHASLSKVQGARVKKAASGTKSAGSKQLPEKLHSRVMKQIQQLSETKPSMVVQKQKILQGHAAVVAQVNKRGINAAIQQLGSNPIKRVAKNYLKLGVSAGSGIAKRRPPVHHRFPAKVTEGSIDAQKKILFGELQRLASDGTPSEIVAKRNVAEAKKAVNAQVGWVLMCEMAGQRDLDLDIWWGGIVMLDLTGPSTTLLADADGYADDVEADLEARRQLGNQQARGKVRRHRCSLRNRVGAYRVAGPVV
ncbi:uncharacterized protein BJ171DRAFT_8468 [Polychytrium aggregatum]|uniref:uncharacterized protein n=1 Tax=Polychytrium aggregatum TaxID=110093 RepID=UPI0022FE37C2|nr:uncharacterized protein BJ171DRAFT_8468 [Polychytrium aggregatum]KAI9209835.1 hypothetical protein BJ171DRAFT_8468 [Polychytrium aggregatum]